MWPANDPYENLVDIPDSLSQESAVIIFQNYINEYRELENKLVIVNATRRRIKLLDRNSINSYSEFNFEELYGRNHKSDKLSDFFVSEIKLIKPNGNIIDIDLSQAVDYGEAGKKIAIPNLETGDILDFYYYEHEVFTNPGNMTFPPIVATLNHEYPILYQDINLTTDKNFHVNLKTINGAPEVKSYSHPDDQTTTTYTIRDANRMAEEYLQWFYPHCELPTIKFQVSYLQDQSAAKELKAFVNSNIRLKQQVSSEEVLSLVNNTIRIEPLNDERLTDYIYSNDPNSTVEHLKLAYNFLRFYRFVDLYERFMYSEAGLGIDVWSYGNTILTDENFIEVMGGYLLEENIPFEILATIPRQYGPLDELILADELTYMIKVNLDHPVYLSRFTTNTSFNAIPFDVEGQEAYCIVVSERGQFISLKKQLIPESNSNNNKSTTRSRVSWNSEAIDEISIERNVELYGKNMDFDREELLSIYNIILEEEQRLDLEPFPDRFDMKESDIATFNELLLDDLIQTKLEQTELFKITTSSEYDFDLHNYKHFGILNTGRWDDEFKFEDQFTTKGLAKKSGSNVILNVGQLIGKQMSINACQVERNDNVHMAFARSFEDEITIDIPDGYQVIGIDQLNTGIENITGGFISKAKLKDKKLHILARKFYSKNTVSAKNWPLMLEFLDAAYQFSQEKILLRKIKSTESRELKQ
ncbi:MAG: DUF3857 domain-containing protein [Bacteroidia bacterium]|nr:DUF3857 domain-containing protein [Bacteroidia bacterium]